MFLVESILIIFLFFARNGSLYECYNILLANEPFSWIVERTGFVILVLLLQFLNGNMMIYYIKNKSYFYVRTIHEKKMVINIIIRIIINLIVFIGAYMIAVFVINRVILFEPEVLIMSSIVLSMIKGFGKLFIFSCVQFVILILLPEDKALLVFVVCVILFSVLNVKRINLPIRSEINELLFVAIIYIIISLVAIMVINRVYRKEKYRIGY